jgi:hypothetical protein
MKDLVMRTEDNNGDITGFFLAAQKLLNRASVERTISKQEAMCLVGPGEADWGGHFRSRDIATLVAIRRKCTGHILKLR